MSFQQSLPHFRPGDRVQIDPAVTTLPALPGHVGVVKEVIHSYADQMIGYNLTVENDPRPDRIWFLLQHQLTHADSR
jgi:hypothetical protein